MVCVESETFDGSGLVRLLMAAVSAGRSDEAWY